MWSSANTATMETTQRSARSAAVKRAVLHHATMTDVQALARLMQPGSSREVSAHVAIGNAGEIIGAVPLEYRAWSLADAYEDSVAVTAEICNSQLGEPWPVSDAAHNAAARFVADCAGIFNFYPQRSAPNDEDWTVIGHREVYTIHGGSYATACPGGLDLYRVTDIAQQRLETGGDASTGIENTKMTDAIYYADTARGARYAKGDVVVEVESMWYQECPGAPLYPLSGGKAYGTAAGGLEYMAFAAGKAATEAKRLACSPAQIGALIALRGQTTKPVGNFVTATGAGVALPDAAKWGKDAAAAFSASLPSFSASGGFGK